MKKCVSWRVAKMLKIILCTVEQLSTRTNPLLIELSKNVRLSGRKRKLRHGNRLVWKIKGKVAKVAYSFCLLVILWEQQKTVRISYSFIVLYPCLRTVVNCWCGVILAKSSASHAPVPRVVAPGVYFRFPSDSSCFRFRIMQTQR